MTAFVHHRHRRTAPIAAMFAAFLAILGLAVGNLVVAPSAQAQGTPIFWSNGSRWDYFGFINNVRQHVNAYNNAVPGTASTIDHTDPQSTGRFLDVFIGTTQNHQVRIRLRYSDLYVVGWFTHDGTYNYVGPATEASWNAMNGPSWQLNPSGNYVDLERQGGGFNRATTHYDATRVNAFAENLWNANNPRFMANAVIYFAQFISEATRFRGISDRIGWDGFSGNSATNYQFSTALGSSLVWLEQNWSNLSQRFNWMLANNVTQDSRFNALTGYYQDAQGIIQALTLLTMADYGRVMNCVRGYPGRP